MEEQARKYPKLPNYTENTSVLSTLHSDITLVKEELKGKFRKDQFLSKIPKLSVTSSNNTKSSTQVSRDFSTMKTVAIKT